MGYWTLPWVLVGFGFTLVCELLKIPSLPFAVGDPCQR